MPALIEATEMMIQHVDIITMVPNSFIQQLRAYNVEQAKNGHQKVKTPFFRMCSKFAAKDTIFDKSEIYKNPLFEKKYDLREKMRFLEKKI